MNATIQKWGNSHAIRLPKAVIETVSLRENEHVQIFTELDTIIIKKVKNRRMHIPLAERLEGWEGQPYELTDEDREWLDMKPVGEEVW